MVIRKANGEAELPFERRWAVSAEECAGTCLLGLGYSLGLKSVRRKRSQVKGDFQRLLQSSLSWAERTSSVQCKTKHRPAAEVPMMSFAFYITWT